MNKITLFLGCYALVATATHAIDGERKQPSYRQPLFSLLNQFSTDPECPNSPSSPPIGHTFVEGTNQINRPVKPQEPPHTKKSLTQ